MAIAKKEVSSPAPQTVPTVPGDSGHVAPAGVAQPGLTKDQGMARCNAMNNTFGAGWFKDTCQVMPLEDAVKKAFEVAGQIEAWLTR